MSKIYEYFGIIFYLYGRDHYRVKDDVHIHVIYGEYESKVEFIFIKGKLKGIKFIRVKGHTPIPAAKVKLAKDFIKKYHKEIIDKWTEFYIKKNVPKFEKIRKKV